MAYKTCRSFRRESDKPRKMSGTAYFKHTNIPTKYLDFTSQRKGGEPLLKQITETNAESRLS